jgi:hypothetical protein
MLYVLLSIFCLCDIFSSFEPNITSSTQNIHHRNISENFIFWHHWPTFLPPLTYFSTATFYCHWPTFLIVTELLFYHHFSTTIDLLLALLTYFSTFGCHFRNFHVWLLTRFFLRIKHLTWRDVVTLECLRQVWIWHHWITFSVFGGHYA